MVNIRGNYILFSALNVLAGLVILFLLLVLKLDYVYSLAAVLFPFVVFQKWFTHHRRPDEREVHILLKVSNNAAVWTLVTLPYWHSHLGESFFAVIWAVFMILRGGFGLFFFLKDQV